MPAIELFLALQTQWRVSASMAGLIYHGIDYQAAQVVMRARRMRERARLLEDLQVMEGAAMKELNRRD